MLTIDRLNEYGANTAEGLERCMGNADFYLRLVGMALADGNFARLRKSIDAGDLTDAFEAAHSLKGVLGNLALGPLYNKVFDITELLRARKELDYGPLLDEIDREKAALDALAK